MTDIVERLRELGNRWEVSPATSSPDEAVDNRLSDALLEAANEIDRLQRSAKSWEDEARRYASNADYWKTEAGRLRVELGETNEALAACQSQAGPCIKDAERYRWLQEQDGETWEYVVGLTDGEQDEFIDAALGEKHD